MPDTKNTCLIAWRNRALIILGAAIFSFAFTYIVSNNNLYEGGVSGVTLILKDLFHVSPAITNLLLNIPLFIIGWIVLGKQIIRRSLLGTAAVIIWMYIFEHIPLTIDLHKDFIIIVISAGLLMGLGLGIIFKAGGTTGGTDILARIIQRRSHLRIGQIMLIIDCGVLLLSVAIRQDIYTLVYTLIMVTLGSRVIDIIEAGGYGAKGVMIVTRLPQELSQAITDKLQHGITFIKGQGFYSKDNLNLVYTVIDKTQIVELKELLHSIDPHAFITITEVQEVLGEGFTLDADKNPIVR